MATYLQLLGAVLVAVAITMLAGPWWACLVVGGVMVALGYLVERASPPRSAPSDRSSGPTAEGGRS